MNTHSPSPAERMKMYLQKIATGPSMSKDLTEAEAEDALGMILEGSVSAVRAGVFLIAARVKRETLEENAGYWKALDRTTRKRRVQLERLLQVADPFDGFDRAPYFGFYSLPVIAAMGLPVYGHSSLSLPPKFGITFEDLLHKHYRVPAGQDLETRARLIEEFRFGYLSLQQSHPALDGLRDLRVEIVKRTMLSTFEKMLMPLEAGPSGTWLVTGYFHRGYEVPMLEAARRSGFGRTVLGNGQEGATLFGVHKKTTVFIECGEAEPQSETLDLQSMLSAPAAEAVATAWEDLKKERVEADRLAQWGESALKENRGPAATLIAAQAGSLGCLFGVQPGFQEGFDAAVEVLQSGKAYDGLMRYLDRARNE